MDYNLDTFNRRRVISRLHVKISSPVRRKEKKKNMFSFCCCAISFWFQACLLSCTARHISLIPTVTCRCNEWNNRVHLFSYGVEYNWMERLGGLYATMIVQREKWNILLAFLRLSVSCLVVCSVLPGLKKPKPTDGEISLTRKDDSFWLAWPVVIQITSQSQSTSIAASLAG